MARIGISLGGIERSLLNRLATADAAVTTIGALADSDIEGKNPLNGSADFLFSGRNTSQVASLSVASTGAAGAVVAVTPAQATYTGVSRYVAADATIRVSGSAGTGTNFAITTDDTLEAVAAQISSASGLLSDMEEDLQDAIDQTDGYNEEEEEMAIAMNIDLANNALAGLALLNQQRRGIVTLIQQIAGLI